MRNGSVRLRRCALPVGWGRVLLWLWLAIRSLAATPAEDEGRRQFFEQRIRPVLVEQCYECHSATSARLKGGLRLDTRDGVRRGGDSGPAILAGEAVRSRLIEAVRYGNRELQMPPKGRLPEPVIADLVRWIDDGAFDPRDEAPGSAPVRPVADGRGHWAFQPIRDVVPPGVAGADHPVDRFLQARRAAAGLSPAPEADRRTLIRRATFDLTGLPPTPEEIAAFLADTAPGAFERLVDRLLASPRYGERWGRWWLDLARYADSNGQDENKVMANAWRYRDWVVRSFNANEPFDAFLTEQLAGDLLPTNGVSEEVLFDRWTATGFLVLGPKMLAEQDKPKLVMDLVDEQIDVVSRAFLGLTVGCARCHDHKFDPVPARDYYALAGIFRSTRAMANLGFVSKFNERSVTAAAQREAIVAHARELAARTNAVKRAVAAANQALLAGWRSDLPRLLTAALDPVAGAETVTGPGTNLVARLRALGGSNEIGVVLRRAAVDPSVRARLTEAPDLGTVAPGLRLTNGRVGGAFEATGGNHLELPSSPALEPAQLTVEAWVRAAEIPSSGDGRRWLVAKNASEWAEGHYALVLDRDRPGAYLNIGGGRENVFALWSERPVKAGEWHALALTYDGAVFRLFVDGAAAGEARIGRPRVPGTGPLVLGRRPDGFVNFRGALDEVRVWPRALSATELQERVAAPERVDPAGAVARWEFNELSPAEREALAWNAARDALFGAGGVLALPADPAPYYPAATRAEIRALEERRDAWRAAAPEPEAFALAVEEDQVVDLPVHLRGSHLNLAKDPVPRGFLTVAAPGPAQPLPVDRSGRLELARWLTDPAQPLTARVVVNRIWQAHFGEGLVRTPDNFGLRGEPPTHPELLDWLAGEFRRTGWDVKRMHRLLLTSAAWRQAAVPSGGPEGEAVTRGRQADPDNRLLWRFPRQRLEAEMIRDALLAVSGRLDATAGGSLVSWKNDEYAPPDEVSAGSVRRSIYLPVVRDRVFDALTIFDFANPSVGTAKRVPTVVSHQALFFLNSPLVKDSARALAGRVLAGVPDDTPARVRRGYELAFGRLPGAAEIARSEQFLRAHPARGGVAAWTSWCEALLAANEFVYRE